MIELLVVRRMKPGAEVTVLSEVAERLMMIFGVGALTCATKCGRKRLQPIDRGHPTAVPAGTSPATSSAGDCARAFSGLTESRQIPFGLRS